MKEWRPIIASGDALIQILNTVSLDTLVSIRSELGEETFANCDVIRILETKISERSKSTIESMDTISVEPPEFD